MRAHPSPLVIGHRGAPGYRPEHTSASYELAFALGADAVEPDIVATRDGVLVLRHENEISSTTDVASRPEFAARRTTKIIDGVRQTGWFTEDFTWAELATLRAIERLGELRQASSSFDGRYPIMRLAELFALIDGVAETTDRDVGMVAEIKHATYFDSIGLPLDELFAEEAARAGWGTDDGRLVIESFESDVLARLHARGVRGKRVYLIEAQGAPYDRVARDGSNARGYADDITEAGLYRLASATGHAALDGVSVNASIIAREADLSTATRSDVGVVDRAHGVGLAVFCWTLRPENRFLAPPYRIGRQPARYGRWQDAFARIMATGVDGVFLDHPDLGVTVRDELASSE
jgi:glycerophosphoryl diester phosphodiesterase